MAELYFLDDGNRCGMAEVEADSAGTLGIGGAPAAPEAIEAMVGAVGQLHEPLGEIRDLLGRTKTERLADEIKRTLHNMGYDRVTIKTDLATFDDEGEDSTVQVEAAPGGVTTKG